MQYLKVITLNCQKGYQPKFKNFLENIVVYGEYDFILLQEVTSNVLQIIEESANSYSYLNLPNEDVFQNSPLYILYRNNIFLEKGAFLSFAKIRPPASARIPFGLLLGKFRINNTFLIVGTMHLNSGINSKIRLLELEAAKEKILTFVEYPILFGGDFNTASSWELRKNKKVLSPEFIHTNSATGTTLDSRFTEYAPNMLNIFARILSWLGISIKFKTDHIFISNSFKDYLLTARVLKDRVSDHSPLELEIERSRFSKERTSTKQMRKA